MDIFRTLLSDDGFMPHGHCYLWDPGLLRLHLVSDFLIAAAYFTIPFTLLSFVRRRKDLPFHWMFVCFGLFIVACGLTHVMEIITVWKPYYWLSGAIKAVTALASVPTALLLVRLVPQALAIPGPQMLRTANEALIEQTKMLMLIVSNIGDALLVVDSQGRTLLSNPPAKRMFGLPEISNPNAPGEKIPLLRADEKTPLTAEEMPTTRAIAGEAVDDEELFVRANGDAAGIWAKVTARPLRDENGIIHGAVALFRDVTIEKQAETQEKNLQRERAARLEAETANSAKDKFLAMLGHELRTPLTPVLASVDLLERDASAEAIDALEVIRRNVELEARLIDDMLDLTAITKGKIKVDPRPIDAHELLREAVSGFDVELKRRKFQVVFRLQATAHVVQADPARLLQVFWNLVKNALKFTPDGGELTLASRNEGRDLVIEVADNGTGIERTFLPRVFDSFEQAERQVREGHGGLGLGLAISKGIIDAHDGELLVHSDGRGQGTTFTVRLATTAELPAQSHGAQNSRSERSRQRGALKILLVEDHKDTVRTLKLLLTRLGYHVVTAENVAGALKLADAERFDLLLTDIGLPDGSGLDLMRAIRERQSIQGIAVSGFGMEEDLQRSREAGFLDHLTKPINVGRLQAAIREAQAQLN